MSAAEHKPGGAGIIWLASYPKSGNTWVRLFLSILRGGEKLDLAGMPGTAAIATNRALLERYLDLDIADLSWQETASLRPFAYRAMAGLAREPRIFKVHDSHGLTPSGTPLFPPEASLGCVHIVRDPRDVCLSLAAHYGIPAGKAIATMSNENSISSNANKIQVREHRGSWSSHCESWLAAPLRRLTLRYEDMLDDPIANLGSIARFCGIDADPQAVERAVAATSFSELAAAEAKTGFRERPEGMTRFFREGKAGQWRDALDPGQIAQIEQDHGISMRRVGYELVTDTMA